MFQGADAAVMAGGSSFDSLAQRDPVPVVASRRYVGHPHNSKNAYDEYTQDKCNIQISTTKGGNCETWVQCEKDNNKGQEKAVQLPWSGCGLNFHQLLYHELVGNFSVEFTQAGGVNSDVDGLHHPILSLAAYHDWYMLNIEDQLQWQKDGTWGGKGDFCKRDFDTTRAKYTWTCGFPKLAKVSTSNFGVTLMYQDSDKPVYTPGWCTAHVTQYQRNEYGNKNSYAFAVQIYDGAGDQIGHVQKASVDDNGHLAVNSKLPFTLVLDAGPDDNTPVRFAYSDQSWVCDASDDAVKKNHLCTLGTGDEHGYQNGDRTGDMGFPC
ncbi:hypothetical protein GGR54DRAFT_632843 [Hypoxylon sp. NC1633]|nr:hypothetical protein GGR54DRAFT_632843 [Hypoxylon sp. NC1633]